MRSRAQSLIGASLAALLLFPHGAESKPPAKPTPTPATVATSTPSSTRTPTPTKAAGGKKTPTPTPRPTSTPGAPGAVSVVITEPAPDAMIDSDRVNVRGTFSGPAGTGIVVNDTIALARGGRFALNELPLTAGSNTISVVATAIDGRTATTSISVTSSGSPPRLRLTADTTSGTAPLSVTFGYDRSETTTVTKIAIDFDGNGTDDFTSKKTPPTQVQNTYTVPGLYQARLRLADSSGTTLESYSSILVESQSERDDLFTSLWSGMNDALLKRDVSTALSYLNSRARPRYATVFQDLLPDMPAIIATYSVPHFVSSYFGVLEYAVNRLVDDEDQIYFIYLMRDADGVWRFEAM